MENSAEWIGWASSMILMATLSNQVWKQWKEKSAEAVSIWLFLGQITAQVGFVVYSFLLGNMVFIVTNSFLFFVSVLGFAVTWKYKRGTGDS